MKNNKIHINESTSTSSGGRGSYIAPLQPGLRPFKKDTLAPFTDSVSDYDSPLLQYDSYDGKMDERRKQIKQIEKTARKITDYIKRHPDSTFSDEDGNIVNQYPKGKNKKGIVPIKEWDNFDDIVIEASSTSSGEYNGPQELGLKKWTKPLLKPFTEFVDSDINHKKKQKTMKNNIKKEMGVWEKGLDGTYDSPTHDVHTINEWIEINDDLIVENLFKRPKSGITSTTNKKTSQNESFEVRFKKYLLEFVNRRKS